MREIGSALGIAILGTVLFTVLANQTAANLAKVPGLPVAAQDAIVEAIDASAGQALTGFRLDPQYAFVVLGLIFSFLLPETRPDLAEAPVATEVAADVP